MSGEGSLRGITPELFSRLRDTPLTPCSASSVRYSSMSRSSARPGNSVAAGIPPQSASVLCGAASTGLLDAWTGKKFTMCSLISALSSWGDSCPDARFRERILAPHEGSHGVSVCTDFSSQTITAATATFTVLTQLRRRRRRRFKIANNKEYSTTKPAAFRMGVSFVIYCIVVNHNGK